MNDSWAEQYIDGKPTLRTQYNVMVGPNLDIGKGVDETINIRANNADLNKPILRYNHATNAWQYSNDGVTFVDIRGPETLSHAELSDMPDTLGTNTDHDVRNDARYLKLNQSTPQEVINGAPKLKEGLEITSGKRLYLDE